MNRGVKPFIFQSFLMIGLPAFTACSQKPARVVAKVGSTSLTANEISTRLQEAPLPYQQYVSTPDGRRQFVDLLVREKVLLVMAQRAGLENDLEVKKALTQFKEQMKRRLKQFEEGLLIDAYVDRLRRKELVVSDPEASQFYQAHLQEYLHPTEVQASHILAHTEAQAREVLSRLKKGESFETLARELSADPATAAQGGRLTPFRRGQLVPEFEATAFALKPGAISDVVKTQFGYHIIKKTGETSLAPPTLEQAKEEIRQRLQKERFDKWMEQTRKSLGVQLDDKALAMIQATGSASSPLGLPR